MYRMQQAVCVGRDKSLYTMCKRVLYELCYIDMPNLCYELLIMYNIIHTMYQMCQSIIFIQQHVPINMPKWILWQYTHISTIVFNLRKPCNELRKLFIIRLYEM